MYAEEQMKHVQQYYLNGSQEKNAIRIIFSAVGLPDYQAPLSAKIIK